MPDIAIGELDDRPSLLCSDDAIPHVDDTPVADTAVTDIAVAENYLNVLVLHRLLFGGKLGIVLVHILKVKPFEHYSE